MLKDKDRKDIIGFDFEGWPLWKITWREVLEKIGFKEEGDKYVISKDSEILNSFPLVLEDDGMGYGVNEKFVTSVNDNGYMFVDKPMSKDELKKQMEEMGLNNNE